MIDTADLPPIPAAIPVGPAAWRDRTDVIIIGTGAAGLSAAIGLLEAGRQVTMITKGEPGDGSTAWAQGGLAAVIDAMDSVDDHLQDTLVAGAGLCEPDQVAALVAAAPEAIDWLDRLGADFDRAPDGNFALGLEGGHHARRIVHAGGDASGAAVARALTDALPTTQNPPRGHQNPGFSGVSSPSDSSPGGPRLDVLSHTTVIDLLRDDHGVIGVRLYDADGKVGEFFADAVVLASGGIGQAWDTTTNPATATGDGLALALRAGAVLRDVEFVQFHPTVLVVPDDHRRPGDRGVLISEAVRGEGARLINSDGELIMAGRHPLADLAPRDVVAATMYAELLSTGDDHLFLDGTQLGEAVWTEHFPTILRLCRERGVDPVDEPIPVRPAEHYWCGGVLADLDGRTTVPGLYAIGEVASTGVQGANRLASNSLTEAVVAGRRCAQQWTPREHHSDQPASVPADRSWAVPAADRERIVSAISAGIGVLRDENGMRIALKSLDDVQRVGAAGPTDVETTNLYTVGVAIGAAALARRESRGCHRRSDHPAPADALRRHSLLRSEPDNLTINHSEELR